MRRSSIAYLTLAAVAITLCAGGLDAASAGVRDSSCAATTIHPAGDDAPAWARARGPRGTPFVIARGDPIVGFLFVDLQPRPRGTHAHNKILWHIKRGRDGDPLIVRARRAGSDRLRTWSWPATATPGKIYPSYLDVRKAGCWTVQLEWGNDHATVVFEIPAPRPTG